MWLIIPAIISCTVINCVSDFFIIQVCEGKPVPKQRLISSQKNDPFLEIEKVLTCWVPTSEPSALEGYIFREKLIWGLGLRCHYPAADPGGAGFSDSELSPVRA